MNENDPLWKMRHALAGMAVALLLSVVVAALIGRLLGDAFGGDYGARVTVYSLLLVYLVVGAVVLFVKVAQFETRALTLGRIFTWLASLWLWPALLLAARKKPAD